MIVNMACPKCGGQSTEYDDKKWSCLRCGNKFVYEPTQANHTLIQSNVSIQGQATFELDVAKSKPPVPKLVKMIDYDKSYFGNQIVDKSNEISNRKKLKYPFYILQAVCLCACVLFALLEIVCIISIVFYSDGTSSAISNTFVLLFLFSLIAASVLLFLKFRKKVNEQDLIIKNYQEIIYSLQQANLGDTKIGNYIICPHCENEFEYIHLNAIPPIDSLKHCLSCGRQFFTSGLTSYPIMHK